nr:MAG: nucleocapsid protein [Wenzhou rodent jeilongvirus 1]
MASLNETIKEFKHFKSNPHTRGVLHAAFQGVKNKVIVLVPVGLDPPQRWLLMTFLLQLVWSELSPGSVITGALISLLAFFSEQPAQLIQAMLGDPDIEIQIIDVVKMDLNQPKFATRGASLDKIEMQYQRIAKAPPKGSNDNLPYVIKDLSKLIPRTVEELQISVGTVTLQIWILLTKAVTAPDTARDSEMRRWIKYTQQRRADKIYKLESKWCDNARLRIASDLPVRRFMVNILMEINQSTGVRGRIVEMIADIGSYIAEAGLAGFFTTVKYGIETKYSALALSELQGDLSTVLGLMKYYKTLGDKAPYLVILEDSAQVKFAPGSYPLLYSYAMGIATALDRSMAGLIYDKGFLEPAFFRLGRSMVHHLEGNVDMRMAQELGLTSEQTTALKEILRADSEDSGNPATRRQGRGTLAADPITTAEDIIPADDTALAKQLSRSVSLSEDESGPSARARTPQFLPVDEDLKADVFKNKQIDKEKSVRDKMAALRNAVTHPSFMRSSGVSGETKKSLQDELRRLMGSSREYPPSLTNRAFGDKPTNKRPSTPPSGSDMDVLNQSA